MTRPSKRNTHSETGLTTNPIIVLMLTRTPAIPEALSSIDGVYFRCTPDPESGILPALTDALLRNARCVYCDAPPRPDFSNCPCDRKRPLAFLRKAQGNTCYFCGASTFMDEVIEHLVPLDRKGRDDFANIMVTCLSCSAEKGHLNERQFWRQLEKQFPAEQFKIIRNSAKDMKKKKWERYHYRSLSYFELYVERRLWDEVVEPLWRKDLRRVQNRNGFVNIMLACPSCNFAKGSLNERQYWKKLQNDMPPAQYHQVRAAAINMKKEKWRIYRRLY